VVKDTKVEAATVNSTKIESKSTNVPTLNSNKKSESIINVKTAPLELTESIMFDI